MMAPDEPLVHKGANEPVFIAGPQPPILGAMNTGSNLADLRPPVLGESLPPISALLKLMGAPLLLEALRATGLHRKVLIGFRETPQVFRNPVVQKRLEEAVQHPDALDKLSRIWNAASPPALQQIETLTSSSGSGALAPLLQQYSLDVIRWGLLLIGTPESKAALEELPSLFQTDPAQDAPPSEDSIRSPIVSSVAALALQIPPLTKGELGGVGDIRTPENEALNSQGQTSESDAETPIPAHKEQAADTRLEHLLKKSQECVESLEKTLREERRERTEAQVRLQEGQRDAAEQRKKAEEARKGAEEWQRRARTAENEVRSAARQSERLQRSLDEMTSRVHASERREKKLQESLTIAVQAAAKSAEGQRESTGSARPPAASASSRQDSLMESVESVFKRLMEKRRFTAVADYARELWERDRSSAAAFGALVEALQAGGQQEEAARLYYEVGTQALAEGRHGNAVEAFAQSIRCAPESPDAAWRIEKLLRIAEPSSREDLESVARLYGELRRQSFEAASTFETLARRLRRSLWRRLPALMTEEHKRVAVTWTSGGKTAELSASELAASVAAGDVDLVDG
ncbi:MAG: hypothetical protein M3Y56_10555, partial [Armatimonadota bacterium]|nr:hypothetical protein [Armatimonadota bacterium]